jgi:predicted cobalt transporter CbtA
MNLSPGPLFIGIIAGAFGVAYFMYGKRQAKLVAMISGAALCIYPYFFDSVLWLIVVGVALLAAPFLIDF